MINIRAQFCLQNCTVVLISLFFFDDDDDELYIFIPVVNVQIFNATEELAIPEETPTNDANAEIEAHE